jgi:hypothetical protein
MVELTMQIPDELAKRVVPMSRWLPTILELSLVGFKTPAAETAGELIDFLSEAPSRRKLLNYHVSNRAQTRLQRLLALNEAGISSEAEQRELDELQKIEHIMIMLKARLMTQPRG